MNLNSDEVSNCHGASCQRREIWWRLVARKQGERGKSGARRVQSEEFRLELNGTLFKFLPRELFYCGASLISIVTLKVGRRRQNVP